MSHPARGAWIETLNAHLQNLEEERRTPLGVRGLKQLIEQLDTMSTRSHPARGAWIETLPTPNKAPRAMSHPARGAWIETYTEQSSNSRLRRTPLGVRGLKLLLLKSYDHSLSRRTPLGVRGLKHIFVS